MKKSLIMLAVVSAGLLLLVGTSMATFINPNSWDGLSYNLQNTLNGLLVNPADAPLVNATGAPNDALAFDATWSIGATGSSANTFVVQITGFTTTENFGIFDATDKTKMVELFSPTAAPGDRRLVSIDGTGEVFLGDPAVDTGVKFAGNLFGYFIGGAGGNTFYSIDSLNVDGNDHMVAFAGNGKTIKIGGLPPGVFGPGEFILAFEDLPWNGPTDFTSSDRDYNDTVVMVESVTPVPEPATMLLLGSGLIGLAGFARRKFKK